MKKRKTTNQEKSSQISVKSGTGEATMQKWIRAKIYLQALENSEEVILRFVKPLLEKLDEQELMETFHFFRYFDEKEHPIPFIDLRVKPKREEYKERIETMTKGYAKSTRSLQAKEIEFSNDYKGEEEDFGKDGWSLAERFFEVGSRVAICKVDPSKDKIEVKNSEAKFHEAKFVHLLLNQIGYSIEREGLFHLDRCVERMLKIHGKAITFKKIREILERVEGRIPD